MRLRVAQHAGRCLGGHEHWGLQPLLASKENRQACRFGAQLGHIVTCCPQSAVSCLRSMLHACLACGGPSSQVLFARQKPHRSTESNDDWKAVMKVCVDCASCVIASWLECGMGVGCCCACNRSNQRSRLMVVC